MKKIKNFKEYNIENLIKLECLKYIKESVQEDDLNIEDLKRKHQESVLKNREKYLKKLKQCYLYIQEDDRFYNITDMTSIDTEYGIGFTFNTGYCKVLDKKELNWIVYVSKKVPDIIMITLEEVAESSPSYNFSDFIKKIEKFYDEFYL